MDAVFVSDVGACIVQCVDRRTEHAKWRTCWSLPLIVTPWLWKKRCMSLEAVRNLLLSCHADIVDELCDMMGLHNTEHHRRCGASDMASLQLCTESIVSAYILIQNCMVGPLGADHKRVCVGNVEEMLQASRRFTIPMSNAVIEEWIESKVCYTNADHQLFIPVMERQEGNECIVVCFRLLSAHTVSKLHRSESAKNQYMIQISDAWWASSEHIVELTSSSQRASLRNVDE